MIQRLQGAHISQVPALIVVDLSMAALVGLGTGKCEREISRMNGQIRFPFLWDRNIYIYIYIVSLSGHTLKLNLLESVQCWPILRDSSKT